MWQYQHVDYLISDDLPVQSVVGVAACQDVTSSVVTIAKHFEKGQNLREASNCTWFLKLRFSVARELQRGRPAHAAIPGGTGRHRDISALSAPGP